MSLRHFSTPLTATVLTMLAVGCASAPPPPELLDARSAYIRAESGPAAQLKPDSLHEAKVALDKAERAYSDDPKEQKTRDIAYLAVRRAELAEVEGREAKAAQDKARAEKEIAGLTQSQLSNARQQLASASDRLTGTEQQLASERAAREAAEKRAREAIDRLAAAAAGSIKQETRGTVITIPGSVLFASAKTALLPGAQAKLNAVADALKEQADHEIIVEGHTDGQGSDASNLELSQGRAQSVRDYLVSRGVPANRIKAVGVGEARPVADNNNPEGRANNRRVEIIVAPVSGQTGTTGSTGTTGASGATGSSGATGTSGGVLASPGGMPGAGSTGARMPGAPGAGAAPGGGAQPGPTGAPGSTPGASPGTGPKSPQDSMPTERRPPAGGSSPNR
jgi:outer membrane protein OmpA-like peptidoglycan-associated protein